MTTLELKTHEGLRDKLGESLAKDVLELLEEKSKSAVSAQRDAYATKEELKKVETEIRKEDTRLEVLLKNSMADLKIDFNRLDQKLETRFAEFETRIIRQIYCMNLLAIIGSILAIFKFLK